GVAELEDIETALEACYKVGNKDITLLKCTSQYPATYEKANLQTMVDMKERFGVKIGLSDHTMGYLVPTVAASLGAEVIEKHFILDRSLGGPDSSFSMEPEEFKEMVDSIRKVEAILGRVTYEVSDEDKVRRRSLFAIKDINKGEKLDASNIKSIRPGYGLHPKYYKSLMSKKANKKIEKGTPLSFGIIENS